jgi:hypothetical protein
MVGGAHPTTGLPEFAHLRIVQDCEAWPRHSEIQHGEAPDLPNARAAVIRPLRYKEIINERPPPQILGLGMGRRRPHR